MPQKAAEQSLREALARLAAEDLDQVIDEARAEARERVRPILAEALANEMLRQVQLRQATARTPQAPAPASAPQVTAAAPEPTLEHDAVQRPVVNDDGAQTEPITGLYLFCIVRSDAELPENLEGMEPSTTVRLIQSGNLAAAASEVYLKDFDGERLRENLNDMQWLERTARSHESVLETIGRHETLVPMRICTIYRNQEGVIEMLAREAQAFTEALDRLDGKAEWGVKVFETGEPGPVAASAATANGSGADYMRQRQSQREERKNAAQQQHDAAVSIHGRLSAAAAEAMTQPPQRAEMSGHDGVMVLNGVYLVEDKHCEDFLALVEALQNDYKDVGLELEPTGPWPAYNFVPSEIGATA